MRIDPTKTQKESTYQVALDVIKQSPCYNAFLITANVPEIYMQQFWFTITKLKNSSSYQFKLDIQKFEIGVELFCEILHICPRVPNKEFVAPPSHDSLVTFLKSLGYKGSLEFLYDLYVKHMYQPWRTFATIINKCVSGKTSGLDRLQLSRAQILFTKAIIHYFLSKHNSIPKRHDSRINHIKNDGVLGKLKFVSKGVPTQVYGMSIPDVMINDDIKKLKAFHKYLAISTSIVASKKARKGIKAIATPSKKGSIIAAKRLVTEKTASDEESDESADKEERLIRKRPADVVIGRPSRTVSSKEKLDKPQKLKGIQMLSNAAQLASDLKEATKASKKAHRLQQQSTCSNERAGITPEVPDEPKGKSVAHVDDDDSKDEVEILSSDEERIESEKEVVESEKADEKTTNKEEVHSDEENQTDDEHYDKEMHNERHDVEGVDDEKDDKDITDTTKGDEEMVDAENVDDEKTEEENVDDDQAKVKKAEDDQAGALVSVTHNEKPELPTFTSSLSLSPDYGNHFPNVSSDISQVGTIKDYADTEINSLLDIQVQRELPPIQQASLLDILVSVIPTLTTPTPSTTPPTTEVQATTLTVTNPSPTVLLRLSELERKVEALSKVDHSEVIEESVQANVHNEVRNQIPKFLPKAVFEFVNPRIKIIVHDVLQKTPAFLA
ncbi:hypothetical protein Tco_0168811 [Tanacetum coccineum]